MKAGLLVVAIILLGTGLIKANDIAIPDKDIELIKTADDVQVSGTNDLGGAENFEIHNIKAIREFIALLTSDRYTAVPKSLKPKFKSMSAYKVRLSSNGTPVLELTVIADSILDLPGDPMFYMESESYSENLMAPLLRLR
jgi:hypothetical protein